CDCPTMTISSMVADCAAAALATRESRGRDETTDWRREKDMQRSSNKCPMVKLEAALVDATNCRGLGDWGLGTGEWGVGSGEWGVSVTGAALPTPDSRLPTPDSHSRSLNPVLAQQGAQLMVAKAEKFSRAALAELAVLVGAAQQIDFLTLDVGAEVGAAVGEVPQGIGGGLRWLGA